MKNIKLSNLWKAWLSTLIGLLIPVITGALTSWVTGSVDWAAVKASAIPAIILAFTSTMKQVQEWLTPTKKDEA